MFNQEFYPTPKSLIAQMLEKVPSNMLRNSQIMEPSAGKGDILDYLTAVRHIQKRDLYAIEIEPELRSILRDKEYRVVGTDFLIYNDSYHIDLILMNPPFSNGVDHCLKAWDVVAAGGMVVCILNAETVYNAFSEKRRQLAHLIEHYGSMELVGAAFATEAERTTDVECVIVVLNKPASANTTSFEGVGVKFDSKAAEEEFAASPLANGNILVALANQYAQAARLLTEKFEIDRQLAFYVSGIVRTSEDKEKKVSLNEQITELKRDFWRYIFDKTQLGKRATSKFRQDFEKFIAETSQLAFTYENIMSILEVFFMDFDSMIEQCITDVFDQATAYNEKNIEADKRWKTNKSWKLAPKIILPKGVEYDKFGWTTHHYSRSSIDFFNDLDRVMCFLSGEKIEDVETVYDTISTMFHGYKYYTDETGRQHRVGVHFDYREPFESQFFIIKVFKKGTVHLTFKDKDLLARFNQAAAKNKRWVGAGY